MHHCSLWLWPYRTTLSSTRRIREDMVERGHAVVRASGTSTHRKLRTPLSIAFAFVATHNHFVLDRGGKVFKHSAPIIKLPADATEDDHLALLGLLNSSTACFWMKQTFHNKGSTVDQRRSSSTTEPGRTSTNITGTGFERFPCA